MAGSRQQYTDDDRARGFLALTIHDGNVKRVARETGIPESTVRRWKQEWERDGVPEIVHEIAAQDAGEFVDDAVRVRDKALAEIERKIPDAKTSELITVVGVLDDKITRAKGLATHRTEVKHELPSPEEITAALSAAMQGALSAARHRAATIDGEVIEPAPRALEAPREE
ncbi:MAG: helix-turn-helix domain-containing protein [Dehalococcoidia bacterium]|nr:helix-turn-helix domain-containing protein [Dehalococcoidia bacterium]